MGFSTRGGKRHIHAALRRRPIRTGDLPALVQDRVESGELAPSVAYEIAKADDPEAQAEIAARVVSEGLTRGETIAEVRKVAGKTAMAKGRKSAPPRKSTSRVFRAAGYRVTVENSRGIDDASLAVALAEVLDQLRPPAEGRGEAA